MKKMLLITALVLLGIYLLMPLSANADSGMVVMGSFPELFSERD